MILYDVYSIVYIGLAIISKHPIKNMQFLSFTDHGDLFWDYEYFLRRGAGMVTLEPSPGKNVL